MLSNIRPLDVITPINVITTNDINSNLLFICVTLSFNKLWTHEIHLPAQVYACYITHILRIAAALGGRY